MKRVKITETHIYDRELDELSTILHSTLREKEKIPPVLRRLDELNAGIRSGNIVICAKEIV